MKFVALLSGGKDSVFNTIECVGLGHELVCVANLHPPKPVVEGLGAQTEIDSFMYQSVGVEIVPFIAQALGSPIVTREIKGKSMNQELYYEKLADLKEDEQDFDEVEDLFELLSKVKEQYPDI